MNAAQKPFSESLADAVFKAIKGYIDTQLGKIPRGLPGLPGVPGQDGRDGLEGPAGRDGRDALQIDVLDGVDEARTYRRGTYAAHRGGLLRATRDTDEVLGGDVQRAGWQVILNPVVDLQIKQVAGDPRTVEVSTVRAYGPGETKRLSMPVMIHRGVFSEGRQYEPGDTVTWAGSLWHCDEPTTDKPGEGSKVWRLAAKRGRDGRDVRA